MAKNIAYKYRRTATIEADAIYELEMHKSGSLIAVTPLTLVTGASAFANAARKPFVGICEGVVQLGFFIDGKVSVPAGKMHRVRSIGHYKCMLKCSPSAGQESGSARRDSSPIGYPRPEPGALNLY